MKINSKNLWNYINDLAPDEKVKLNVYYDDNYVTQIYWNGENFEWEPGKFTSEAFFNPLFDFVVIEEEKKIPEKILKDEFDDLTKEAKLWKLFYKYNNLIDYLKSKGE